MQIRRFLTALSLVLACATTLALAGAPVAGATPVVGPAGEAFYTPPSPLPEGPAGTLIWYRPATVNLNVSLPALKAWSVLYKSTNELGEAVAVSGSVIVPSEPWQGSGPRPVITYAEGTQGLGHQCAPSLQIAGGTEYDGAAIVAALKRGYAVVVTDYEGYTNGGAPSYIAGKAEAQALLDIVKAAFELPEANISASAPVIIWGYSQGGQAAGWAGEIFSEYAPTLHVIGVAAGGVPANLQSVAAFSEGAVGAAFSFDALLGLGNAYAPSASLAELILRQYVTEEGMQELAKLRSECAVASLGTFHDKSFRNWSRSGQSLPELLESNALFKSFTEDQLLGTKAVPVPVYHYHGLRDEFVPVAQDVALHYAWCKLGVKDDFQLFPGDHLLTDPTAVPYVMRWIEERLAGKEAPSTCNLHSESTPLPQGARLSPETGDLIVPLPEWQLGGSVTDPKLGGITLQIPAGSSIGSEADLTTGTLTGSVKIAPINETIKLFGFLPVSVAATLQPAEELHGTTSLANDGVLSIAGTSRLNLEVSSFGFAFFSVPLGCRTEKPIEMSLEVSESANALWTGRISFEGSTSIPGFTGCSFIDQELTDLILSGSGNKFAITATPPPPISW